MVAGLYFIYSAPFEIIVASLFLYKYVPATKHCLNALTDLQVELTLQHPRMGRIRRCCRFDHCCSTQLVRFQTQHCHHTRPAQGEGQEDQRDDGAYWRHHLYQGKYRCSRSAMGHGQIGHKLIYSSLPGANNGSSVQQRPGLPR